MSISSHEAIALLGTYSHEAPLGYDQLVFTAMGHAAAHPKHAGRQLDHIAQQTDASGLPFTEWRATHQSDPGVAARYALQEHYDAEIAEPAAKLTSWWSDLSPTTHKQWIAHGTTGSVFLLPDSRPDGEEDVLLKVRRARSGQLPAFFTERAIAALIAGEGIVHCAQPVAAFYKKGHVAMTPVPGKPVQQLNLKDIQAVTDEQLVEGVSTIEEISDRRLMLDVRGRNVHVDRRAGIGVFDLTIARPHHDRPYILADNMTKFYQLLANAGTELPSSQSSEFAAARRELAARVADVRPTVIPLVRSGRAKVSNPRSLAA